MIKWLQFKMMLIGLVLLVCLTASGYGVVGDTRESGSYTAVPVYVEAHPVCTGYMEENALYLPLRSFCSLLEWGAVVNWNPHTQVMTVSMTREGTDYTLTAGVGDVYLYIGDHIVYLEQSIRLYGGNVLVPAQALCKAFGVTLTTGEVVQLHTGEATLWTSGSVGYTPGDLQWLSQLISAEAGNQSLEGKICVGNVVMNRVKDARFPNTVEAVIFSPSQFDAVRTGAIYTAPDEASVTAAKLCLEGVNLAGESLYYVNLTTGSDAWYRQNFTYVMSVGTHDFYS